jgi:hypothetical protein
MLNDLINRVNNARENETDKADKPGLEAERSVLYGSSGCRQHSELCEKILVL